MKGYMVLTAKGQCLQTDMIYLVAITLTANALDMVQVGRFTTDTTLFVDQARVNISADILALLDQRHFRRDIIRDDERYQVIDESSCSRDGAVGERE